ncbi:unnamed protein product [Porites lobata]|uniref:G-protein coupled receptors family 1 profile domain-containing protein n=1 Tax=Porites lobata TaxID=104759 RepID=A0ABN8NZH5_9CNID|nr:unnamed protein product [Porites lobata]
MASAEGLHLTLVFFNAFLSFTAIVLNIITMQALRKTSSLPKTLKTLLLSLAVSDLDVGLLVEPLFVAFLVMEKNSTAYSTVKLARSIPAKILVFASHFGVSALAVDRFLAIQLHLRYQELVTHKRVVAVVISLWVFSASISFRSPRIMRAVIALVCVITTGLLYCKIYASVRHHTNQIHALQVQPATQNEDMANAARLKKSSLATFYVYFVYLLCYLPLYCVVFAQTNGETPLLSHLSYFTRTLVYLNSSLNPLIYCWKMRHIRQTVMDILRNIFAICLNLTFVFFNAFLSFTAIVLNIITMQALRKTSSLPKTLKTLLLSLAVSDLGVGLLVHPLYVATLVIEKNSTAYSTVELARSIQAKILVFASNFGVFALAVDRFLAIHLHLRYQELVTHKRVVAVVISVWVFSASISYPSHRIMRAVIVVVCVTTTGLLYCKIYASVRHHTNQIHALQVQQATQNEDMTNAARLKKSSLATFYVYFVYLVCYLPLSCYLFAKTVNGETPLLSHLLYFTRTLVFLNSSLNPLIYCWKMRHIRQTVMDILRNIFAIWLRKKKMASAEGLRLTLVFFNAFLSFTAIVLNIITMQALRKTSSLPKTLKTLLLSLAVSDLGVGLLVQPLYVAILVMEIKQNTNSAAYHTVKKALLIQGRTLVFASHFGVFGLAVDRFLAIQLHLRYQELVTHKRVVAVVISVWVFSASISILRELHDIDVMRTVILVVCVVTTGLLYCKIYASVRHHTNQIHALQVQQATENEDMANAARLKKSSLATFYVYFVYLVCYLPTFCVVFAKTTGETPLLSHLLYFTLTLVFLNSSLNPLIYCWKMRHIRQTVMDILRNIFAIFPH